MIVMMPPTTPPPIRNPRPSRRRTRQNIVPLAFSLMTAQPAAQFLCIVSRDAMPLVLLGFLLLPPAIVAWARLTTWIDVFDRHWMPGEWRAAALTLDLLITGCGMLLVVFCCNLFHTRELFVWSLLLIMGLIAACCRFFARNRTADLVSGNGGLALLCKIILIAETLTTAVSVLNYRADSVRGIMLLSLLLCVASAFIMLAYARLQLLDSALAAQEKPRSPWPIWRRAAGALSVGFPLIAAFIFATMHNVVDWNLLPFYPAETYNPFSGPSGPRIPATPLPMPSVPAPQPPPHVVTQIIWLLWIVWIGCMVGIIVIFARRWLRRHHITQAWRIHVPTFPHRPQQRHSQTADQSSEMRIYYRLLLRAVAKSNSDLARSPTETPDEYAQRLRTALPARANQPPQQHVDSVSAAYLDELTQAYIHARYRDDQLDEATLRRSRSALRHLLRRFTRRRSQPGASV